MFDGKVFPIVVVGIYTSMYIWKRISYIKHQRRKKRIISCIFWPALKVVAANFHEFVIKYFQIFMN